MAMVWWGVLAVVAVVVGLLLALRPGRQQAVQPVAGAAASAPDHGAMSAPVDAVSAQRALAAEALRQARRRSADELARIETARRAAPPPAPPRAVPVAAAPAASRVPAAVAAVTPRPAAALPARPAGPPTVLVVDDSKVVRIKTSRLLEKHGYRVLLADDGLSALQDLAGQRPDLLVTDVEMPGLDGFGLTQRLRADPRWSRLPVIMITSSDDKHRADAAAAGVSLLLGKPYAEDALLDAVRLALGGALPPVRASLALH